MLALNPFNGRWLSSVAWVLVASTFVSPSTIAQTCRPDDGDAQAMLEWATWAAASSDTAAVSTRARLLIPSTTASKVTLVTDTTTCQKAIRAYALDSRISPSRAVYLVEVSTSYILKDPNLMVAESWPGRVLDSKFKILRRFTG